LRTFPRSSTSRRRARTRAELIELLIHEQYFREELMNYQPEIKDKVIASLEWVAERGYEPCFWSEGLLGNIVREHGNWRMAKAALARMACPTGPTSGQAGSCSSLNRACPTETTGGAQVPAQ
jgi:hypothetical protein